MRYLIYTFALLLASSCSKKETEIPTVQSAPLTVIEYQVNWEEIEDKTVKQLYTDLQLTSFWSDSLCVKEALSFLANTRNYGLPTRYYQADSLQKTYRKRHSWDQAQAIAFDLTLTEQFVQFYTDLHQGRLSPSELYSDWDLPKKKLKWKPQYSELFNSRDFDSVAQLVEPKHPQYAALKKKLPDFDLLADNLQVDYPQPFKLLPDSSSTFVPQIRKQLAYWKFPLSNDSSTVYDAEMAKQIKAFQAKEGLLADGIIGKNTLIALNRNKAHLRAEVAAQMERWRWYPKLDSAYILINIPDYSMKLVAEKQLLFSRRVIVGKSGRKTPVLVSELTNIVLNPTWTLPPTIIKEDLANSYKRDTAYFSKKNIAILDYKRNPVDPRNWNSAKPSNYIYVQAPGDDNALGRIKFNFKNRFLVYLHDTNTRSSYNREARALSSGCVRVQDPLPIAEYVLNNPELYSLETLSESTSEGKLETKSVNVEKKLPIYIFYNTVWVNEKGQLIRRPDIYSWNPPLIKQLVD